MLTPRQKIEHQMMSSKLTSLYRALTRLKSSVTLMNTGAHPDDEQSGLLAYLSLRLGMRVIVGCSTRGEGGQSVLGPERLGALGVLRTLEMQKAAQILDAEIYWLGHGPDDPVHDFGFSKDGDGTFAHWGENRIVERMVRAYREERPDIVLPTFLDVPGQHGHHRAMTRAAETALALAADETAYPEHFEEGLKPWRVAKFYLPAWSGGGGTYDDTVPPPSATLTIEATGVDLPTGAAFGRLGEWSRYYHASQGMGVWPERPPSRWQLHLLHGPLGSHPEASIFDHLPMSLTALCGGQHTEGKLPAMLQAADEAINSAVDAFPDRSQIRRFLVSAKEAISAAIDCAPQAFLDLHQHRLQRKLVEIDATLFETHALFERAYAQGEALTQGGSTDLTIVLPQDLPALPDVSLTLPQGVTARLTSSEDGLLRYTLSAQRDAPLSLQYQPKWSSLEGNGATFITITATIGGQPATKAFDLECDLSVIPAHSLEIAPPAFLLPIGQPTDKLLFKVQSTCDDANLSFSAPDGWDVQQSGEGYKVFAPSQPKAGRTSIVPLIDGEPASSVTEFSYPHIGKGRHIKPVVLDILCLDLKLPKDIRVGYVGGGSDNVALWLGRMGVPYEELDTSALSGDLSRFTTILVGIFAFGLRQDLAASIDKLHRFVEEGGHLVTLYHRPSDDWIPEKTPPRFLQIGSPSLRWRVTDPSAKVAVLNNHHPLLVGPNRIGPEDWDGWDKERGLYFASQWDEAYEPLLSLHDANEDALTGALLSAPIGKGRHTHTSLVVHHQMDKLVPGAFRLLANLLQRA
nr:PIG-L family deacetylase [uncultured Cohaesibacter sp.]